MPPTKCKGENRSLTSQRYRPASEFDDATLTQKREYWRNKKREQRARLSGSRNVSLVSLVPSFSSSMTVSSAPLQKNYGPPKVVNISPVSSRNGVSKISVETSLSKKVKAAVVSKDAVKCLSTGSAVSRSITSSKPSRALLSSPSPVPPVRVMVRPPNSAPCQPQGRVTIINGSSSKVTPQQRRVVMQGMSMPKAQPKAQAAICIQSKPLTTSVATGVMLVSSLSTPVPIKAEGSPANATPQVGRKSASVTTRKPTGIGIVQGAPASEEERAAKRRELWRVKKREQRARHAARLAKTRERTQSADVVPQKQTVHRMSQPGSAVLEHLPCLSSGRGAGQRHYLTKVKTPFTDAGRLLKNARASASMPKHAGLTVMKENEGLPPPKLMMFKPEQNQQAVQIKVESPHVDDMTQTALASRQQAVQIKVESPHVDDMTQTTQTALASRQQAVQIKVQNPDVDKMVQAALTSHHVVQKHPAEPSRKFPLHIQFYNTNRGIARCRMTRRGFIETQRSFLGHRSFRGRSPSHAAVFSAMSPPRFDPNESPEQTAARRREYWRVKKREQRAKQSTEVKATLKEKDSMMRRVKRYQNILEEMRRARAEACNVVTQPPGCTITHASETIGGFIKEDGTVTINIPQVPIDPIAAIKIEEVVHLPSNDVTAQPQLQPPHQSKPGGNASYSVMLSDSMRRNPPPPPPPLRPAQVKVSFPLAGQRVNKPPRLLLSRQRSQLESTNKTAARSPPLIIQRPGQIKLTRPPAPWGAFSSAAGPSLGGCVMKMSLSSTGRLEPSRSLVAISLDPELTEEERMAKKREYWRLKKREQRATRTTRLKQGVLQARVSAALQRRRIQKLTQAQNVGVSNMTPSRNVPNHAVNIQPLPRRAPTTPQSDEIKQERDSTPAVDLNSQPEQAICPDIKPPLPPSLGPQSEPDPAQSADSQATTLLAVASMKKLLEETLSTVSECKSEPADVETEACVLGEDSKDEIKASLLSLGDEEKVAADLSFQNENWQGNVCPAPECSSSPHPKASPQMNEVISAPLSSTVSLSESSSRTPSSLRTATVALNGPLLSSPRRAQSLRAKRVGHQQCCSPEPPKLHHLPSDQQCEQRRQRYEQNHSQLMQHQQQRHPQPPGDEEESGGNCLQKKREYWRLMKRQQRAKSKARQGDGGGQRVSDRRLSPKATQTPNLVILNSAKSAQGISPSSKPALQVKPSTATLTAVNSIPTVLVVSPTTSNTGQPPDTLQVKPPVSSVSISPIKQQSFQTSPTFNTTSLPIRSVATVPSLSNHMDGRLLLVENQQETASNPPKVRKWTLQVQERTDRDTAPTLPMLTPPDNPLSSMNLQPIEPLGQASFCTSTPLKIPCPRPQTPPSFGSSPSKLSPISTMVPPKPIPGESEEDFLRRKREYWRVKKKEQRARKAIRDRELSHKRAPNNWKPILPAQGQHLAMETEDSSQWGHSYGDSEQQMSTSSEAELGYYSYGAPVEDDSDAMFSEYDDNNNNSEDGPVSDSVWRNRYLMDHDPLNQLLVCMVCGDLQYSHSPAVVRAHIEEAHPETLSLDAPERRRILEAFDEQVSQRERFFTSQLRQHGGALAEAQRN